MSRGLAEIADIIHDGIAQRMFPGAAVYASRGGEAVFHQAFGRTTYGPRDSRPIRLGDRFDLASVTKLYTATLVLRLVERGRVRLDDPVRRHVPEVEAAWTVEDLLAHRTGTTANLMGYVRAHGIRPCEPGQEDALWSLVFRCPATVELAPGQCHYSDVDLLLAQAVCERAAGVGLAEQLAAGVCRPLGLGDTGFCPADAGRCVPTEMDDWFRHRLVVGEVHDEMAATLGGVAGHAGLFATAAEVGRFGEAWLGVGRRALLREETRRLAFQPHSEDFGLGWRRFNASLFPSLERHGALGHLGFTGTSVFLFPRIGTVLVVLTNRVHPKRDAAPSRLPLLRQIAERVAN